MTLTAAWLTARRIRTHGLIFGLCLWSVFFWSISTPGLRDRVGNIKGADFLHLYTLGSLALEHRGADLYNLSAQTAVTASRVPEAAGWQYLPLYPPQVSLFFAPLAKLPYAYALVVWLAATSLIYAVCCFVVWRSCARLQDDGATVLAAAFAFPAFWHLILWGQTSALALACFTLAFIALRREHEFLAGLALGSLLFKPQLGLASAFVFLLTWRWKVIAGALVAAGVQLSAAWLFYGAEPLREWIRALIAAPRLPALFEPRLYQTHCLRTFWMMLIPQSSIANVLYAASAIVVLILLLALWRSHSPLSVRFSALLFATVLVAPHLTVYDLVIFAPAFLLLADWTLAPGSNPFSSKFNFLLYSAFVLPLVGPLSRWTHFQLSVPVMAAILFLIWKMSKRRPTPTDMVTL